MKNIYQLLICIIFLSTSSFTRAQSVEITPFSGYTFGNSFNIRGGKAKIGPGHTYGGILSITVSEVTAIELLYSRQNSIVTARSTELIEDVRSDAAVTFIMLGGNKILPVAPGKLHVFGGGKLGAGILSSRDGQFSTKTKFAVAGSFGITYYLAESIGLRIGTNIYFPVINTGASLWWGGGGPQVGISSWSPIVQFNLQGGVTIKLK